MSDKQYYYYELKAKEHSALQMILNESHLPEELDMYVRILVDVADVLGIDDLAFSTFSSAICELSQYGLDIKRSTLRMEHARDELEAHLASVEHLQELTERWLKVLQTESSGVQSTAAFELRKTALIAKAKQYQQQLTAVMSEMAETPSITPSQVHALHRDLKAKEQVLREKRAGLQAFQGVPPNLALARLELRNAREEQMKLMRLRERLLDNMASGVS